MILEPLLVMGITTDLRGGTYISLIDFIYD